MADTSPPSSKRRLRLPENFIRDSQECGCDVGEYVAGHLEATDVQLNELRDRAEYYVNPFGPDDVGDGGVLKRSAHALLKALDRQQVSK
jgi:hypothetical protein